MNKTELKQIIKECIKEELSKDAIRTALSNQIDRSNKTESIQKILDSLFLESPKIGDKLLKSPYPLESARSLQKSKKVGNEVINIVNKYKDGTLMLNDISNLAEKLGYDSDNLNSFVSSNKEFFDNLPYNIGKVMSGNSTNEISVK